MGLPTRDGGVPTTWAPVLTADPTDVIEVYGAPGAGKTTCLVKRFQRLVSEFGIRPEEILVLAATRESAADLRNRLLLSLAQESESGGYAVEGSLARTLSSLAFSVVRSHALKNSLRAPELISGSEQDAIIARLLEQHENTEAAQLWPPQVPKVTRGLRGFRAELRDLISVCQETGITPARLEELGAANPEWKASAHIYAGYVQLLATEPYANRFDSTSMVNRAIELLESGEHLPQYRAVMVDDAQELTPSASRLLRHLVTVTGAGVALFGDPDSSTLGFRQADPALMSADAALLCSNRGQSRRVYFLNDSVSQRPAGAGRVLQRISALIGAEGAGTQRKFHLTNIDGSEPEVHVWASRQAEVSWLAHRLRGLHLGTDETPGIPWAEMAVVARTRAQLDELERLLAAEGLPVRIWGAQSALRDEFASRELLELAALVTGLRADTIAADEAERLLRSPYCGLDSVSMRRLRRQLRRQELDSVEDPSQARNSDELLVELFNRPESAATLRGQDARRVRRFLRSITESTRLLADPATTIEDLLWKLWSDSGLEAEWVELSRGNGEVAVQANRNLDATLALFSAANRFSERNPGARVTDFLIAQLEQSLPEDSLALGRVDEATVKLLTPSALVGKSFNTVAIPGLLEGIWPNLKPRGSLLGSAKLRASIGGRLDSTGTAVRTEMADELRMFYKTIGAARERVLVSSYTDEDEQISQFINHSAMGSTPEPEDWDSTENSATLRSIVGARRRVAASSPDAAVKAAALVDLARLAQAGVAGAHPDEWYGLLELSTSDPLFEFVTSEVAASTDRTDIGERITINPSQLEAFVKCPLHWFLNYHGASGSDFSASVGTLVHRAMELASVLDEASLWQQVESGWHTLKFESAWIEQAERRRAQKLVANLSKYLTSFAEKAGTVAAREQDFEFDLGLAHIRGQVDRIEIGPDGKVMIVDLKTSKRIPTKEDAKLHAQLGLYQLAYVNGAFEEVLPNLSDENFDGAKLVLVSGDNPTERSQESLLEDESARLYFEKLVQDSALGMAMPENIFLARVSNHCSVESEFGTCQLHLAKAVSYGE